VAKPPEPKEAPAPVPAAPAAPPTLTVDWPSAAVAGTNKIKGVVTGVNVGVTVNGVKAKVRSGGKFEAKVDLAEGEQAVEVHAQDLIRQEASAKQTLTVAPKPAEPPPSDATTDANSDKKSGSKTTKVKQEASGWE
jgi:hypothetical protein